MVRRENLDCSFCASSSAALRDLSSWSASSNLIFRTASWPSLAERASVRSSTCDRSSLSVRSVWECSVFHLSARSLAWFNSVRIENNQSKDRREKCWPCCPHLSFFSPSCKSFALWMTEAISWLREATSFRSSWFSRRKLDRIWLCGSSVGGGSSGLLDSWGTAVSKLSGVSVVADRMQKTYANESLEISLFYILNKGDVKNLFICMPLLYHA